MKARSQSMFVTLENDLNISDDILTKLEEFVCNICSMRKENVNEIRFGKYYSKYQNGNKVVDISIFQPRSSVVHSKGKTFFCRYLQKVLRTKL